MRLELSVGVRADFAVEVDLFVLRGGPFHGERLLLRPKFPATESITRSEAGRKAEQPDARCVCKAKAAEIKNEAVLLERTASGARKS